MILVNNVEIKPTIFPDQTSQVWKLPEELLEEDMIDITWYFEQERELFDLLSLSQIYKGFIQLYIPYLPYGRQDKAPSNDSTFNLFTFSKILNLIPRCAVYTMDAHSSKAEELINDLYNISPNYLIERVLKEVNPDHIVFPDKGARDRYSHFNKPVILFDKLRDQLTGKITGHEIIYEESVCDKPINLLIIDDICDGGATFISMASKLKEEFGNDIKLHLYVTHGIFSKGRKVLEDVGYTIHTTNSILKNKDGMRI